MKKAQTEIIGLMVLVILFIFVGLMYIMFAGKTEDSITRDVTQSAKVQNMLDAFTQITPCYTETPLKQMDTIIKNCHISGGQTCGQNCEELIKDNFEEVMKAYNPRQLYILKITKPDGNDAIPSLPFIGTPCPAEYDERVATERVLAGGQALTLKLTYCVK